MNATPASSWVMWEARAAEGQVERLLAWVLHVAPPAAQVYRSADRIVLIIESPGELPDPPNDLLARPAYGWSFKRVR